MTEPLRPLPTGALLERRKTACECIACGLPLSRFYDEDAKTGFLKDFCRNCLPLYPAPEPARFDKKAELERGIENLDALLGVTRNGAN